MDEENIQVITRALRLAYDAPIDLVAKAVDALPIGEAGFALQRMNIALIHSSNPELSAKLQETLAIMKPRYKEASRAETSAAESAGIEQPAP